MSAWRAALRIARRDALRHRWRSLLIVVLILAPVAAGTGVDILYRTQTSVELDRERSFGGADARISLEGDIAAQPTQAQLEAALPRARFVPDPPFDSAVVRTPGHVTRTDLVLTDHLGDPLIRHKARLVSGRAPEAPDEVTISRGLADDLGLRGDVIGDRIELDDGASVSVAGIVRDPFCLRCSVMTARTSSAVASAYDRDGGPPGMPQNYLVDLPAGDEDAGPGRFGQLSGFAVVVEMRHQDGRYQVGLGDLTAASNEQLKAAALVTLIAGLGLLEVVLLAGTAFAVGARRQTRDLGLLAAQGGSPRDLRRVVLAQGLLLGVVGTTAGVAAGFGAVIASRPLLERAGNEVMVGLHFGAVEIVVVAVVGVLSGLAAALVPALGASRRRTVDALAARFPLPTARSRWAPILGAVLVAGGGGLGLFAASQMDNARTPVSFAGPLSGCTGPSGCGDDVVYFDGNTQIDGAILILIGVFIAVAGLLLLTPALLAGLARLAGRMPPALRMATRDAARHRHRTGPATAAIAVAVGGAIAISVLIASEGEGPENDNLPAVPARVLALEGDRALDQSQVGAATAAAALLLPGSQVLPVVQPVPTPRPGQVDYYPFPMRVVPPRGGVGAAVAVGDPDLVVIASGRVADRAEAAAALAAGKAIVFDPRLLAADGTIGIDTGDYSNAEPTLARPRLADEPAPEPVEEETFAVRVPAVVLPSEGAYQLPGAYLPESVVRAQGFDTNSTATLISYPPETRGQAAAAVRVAENLGIPVATAAGEPDYTRVVRVGLSAAAALIGLLGVAMCVALSAAEGRPDLATLSAVGAAPGRRRRLAAAQAFLLAALGTALGVVFGFYFARAARPATGALDTIVPWGDLLLTVAAVPLFAVLVGLLGTLGRLPVTRRAD